VYPGCAIQPDALYEQDPVFEPNKALAHSSLNSGTCVVIDKQIIGYLFFSWNGQTETCQTNDANAPQDHCLAVGCTIKMISGDH